MSQEINLGGTIYISSKFAAEKTGYTQDYVGQLARKGLIEAKRVSGIWYILEESLRAYKEKADQFVPTPPKPVSTKESEVAVSFDGKDYISAHRAAKLTGYHQDYIGQLARSGQILSRQVANRWYIDREALLAHKEEKDSLLAAVQAESVGLARQQPEIVEAPTPAHEPETHFNYIQENVPEPVSEHFVEEVEEIKIPVQEPAPPPPVFEEIIPDPMPEYPARVSVETTLRHELDRARITSDVYEEPELVAAEPIRETVESTLPIQEEVVIPIRVVAPEPVTEEVYWDEPVNPIVIETPTPTPSSYAPVMREKKASRVNIYALSGLSVAAVLGTLVYIGSSLGILRVPYIPLESQQASASVSVVESGSGKALMVARNFFSKELVYTRK